MAVDAQGVGSELASPLQSRRRLVPLVDTNALLAIESLFGNGTKDPWATRLACEFTDLFIYSDWFRFTFGSPRGPIADSDIDWIRTPVLVQELRRRDSVAMKPQVVSTDAPMRLHDDYLAESFRGFATWARNNRPALRQWLNTHDKASIRAMQQAQMARQYYFNLDRLTEEHDLDALSLELEVRRPELLYAFDNVLRGPRYGELTGSDQHYLSHPARDVSMLPTFRAEEGPPAPIAISFKESMAGVVRHLSFDEYCVMLHELRGEVRSRGINELGPGNIDREVLRDISASLRLPPRLRGLGRLMLLSGGLAGGLAAVPGVPALAAATAIAGAAVSVLSALWTGQLPRRAARIEWLRWAIEWDLERQAESRQS